MCSGISSNWTFTFYYSWFSIKSGGPNHGYGFEDSFAKGVKNNGWANLCGLIAPGTYPSFCAPTTSSFLFDLSSYAYSFQLLEPPLSNHIKEESSLIVSFSTVGRVVSMRNVASRLISEAKSNSKILVFMVHLNSEKKSEKTMSEYSVLNCTVLSTSIRSAPGRRSVYTSS